MDDKDIELLDETNINKNNKVKVSKKFLSKRTFKAIIPLLLLLLIVSIGYAYVSSSLGIFGTSGIPKMSWDVHFDNIVESENSIKAKSPAELLNNNTKLEFDVAFETLGDKYEFDVDIVNDGTIDAMINSISMYGLSSGNDEYVTYKVTYKNGEAIEEKDLLKAESKTTIHVLVEYSKLFVNDESSIDDLMSTKVVFDVDYIQADEEAVEK